MELSQQVVLLTSPLMFNAIIEFIRRVAKKDWKGAGTILAGAVVGLAAGGLGLAELSVETGLIAGLNSVGLHTVVTARKNNK
jgi:hypothetical protein